MIYDKLIKGQYQIEYSQVIQPFNGKIKIYNHVIVRNLESGEEQKFNGDSGDALILMFKTILKDIETYEKENEVEYTKEKVDNSVY